ncbi:MAG: hypothetical protein AB1439_00665 [candidate division FCPU426 bacterium]
MSNLKGTDILSILKLVKKAGDSFERDLLQSLSEEARRLATTVIPVSWVPVSLASELMDKASKLLYPAEKLPVAKLAEECAYDHYHGVYRVLLSLLTTPEGLMRRGAKLWQTFYDRGEGRVEELPPAGDRKVTAFVVTSIPDLTPVNREFIGHWIMTLARMAGMKDVQYRHDGSNPDRWVWTYTWR